MIPSNTSIFNISTLTSNPATQRAIAQAYADEVKRRAEEIYQAADAANRACDLAIAARKKANDAAYAAACAVHLANRQAGI
jgi:RNase P protein component